MPVRWTSVLAAWFVVATSLPGLASAQPAMIAAVDERMASGDYLGALTLLDRTEGAEAELAGRRAICEANLGRMALVAQHVATALGDPQNAWVNAHRAEIEAALAGVRAPIAAELRAAPVMGAEAPVSSRTETDAPSADHAVATDDSAHLVPDAETPARSSRFVLRAFGGAGIVGANNNRRPYMERDLRPYSPERIGGVMPAFSAGVEGELELGTRASFVADLAFRTIPMMVRGESTFYVETQSMGRTNTSTAPLAFSAGYGVDLTATLRLRSPSSRIFLGFGLRYGFTRSRAKSRLVDTYSDSDGNTVGTPEGTVKVVIGGATVGGVFDVGVHIGGGGTTLTIRTVGGVPLFATELLLAIPIRGH